MSMALLLFSAQVALAGAIGLRTADRGAEPAATVEVQLLGEAGCPFTRQFIVGALNKTLTSPGLAPVLRFDFLPFGNAYFASEECNKVDSQGRQVYNMATRMCFNNHCGAKAGAVRSKNCFAGELVCQHGGVECEANRYFACARRISQAPGSETSRKSFMGYMPFVNCVEAGYNRYMLDGIRSIVESCAAATGQDLGRLRECHDGPEGTDAVIDAAKLTPVHIGVPWLFVDGQPMEADHENDIFAMVCQALRAKGVHVEECGGGGTASFDP